MDVYISGVGMTKFGRSKEPLEKMMAEAASIAMKEAQLEKVDAVFLGIMNLSEFTNDSNFAALLTDSLGLTGLPSTRVETISSSGIGAFETAFFAIASGHMEHVLVIGGEKMTHLPTPKIDQILSEVIDRSERRYGVNMPALVAMMAQKYAIEFNLSPMKIEDLLAHIAIKNHSNGYLNPYAQFRKKITKEDYLKSQMISYPLRLYDCAPITDGASAIILTSHLTPIKVSGIGHTTDLVPIKYKISSASLNSTKESALKAYTMAQINPSEIQFAEVQDTFTPFELIGTEDLGFFSPGEGWKAIEDGVTSLQGRLPINPSGGLKTKGYPAAASGLAQLVEMVYQLRGDLGKERQLQRAEIGLALCVEGLGHDSFVTILERRDRKKILGEGWSPDYHPEIDVSEKKAFPPSSEGVGILETFTTLYSPPEGFRSPFTLGLVRKEDGERVLACNPDYQSPKELKIGKKVYLRMREGLYVFEKLSLLKGLKYWIRDRMKR